MSFTAKKLLAIAVAELGYMEKETNSMLDDKTANAGDGNWTKYARDLHAAGYYQAPKNGYAWCDMFVDWCFLQLGGSKEKGEYLECQTGLYGAGCEWSSDCYRRAGRFDQNPKPGDQIFFGKTDAEEHTGIVEKVANGKVHTIEGNSSNRVQRCSYSLTSSRIVGYGHPRFDAEEEEVQEPVTVTGTPSTGSTADEKTIWDFFAGKGLNHFAIAGIMGNLFAESGLRSNNLQNSYEKKLGYADAAYTAAVDNGTYANFVNDAAGYGLAQWTYWSRKKALFDFAKAAKKSIGDLQMQLDFLWKELQGYGSVMAVLKAATSVQEASDIFMVKFENPADQTAAAKAKRAAYGQKYLDKYAAGAPPEIEEPVISELKVGDIVTFKGTKHHVSSNAPTGPSCKPGKAKITAIYPKGKHPYHLVRVPGGGSTVYGWVDAADIVGVVTEESPKVEDAKPWTPAVGDIVIYNGNKHYTSANATQAKSCKGGKAKITRIYQLGKSKHPYHLVRVGGDGCTVWGWVDADTFTKA